MKFRFSYWLSIFLTLSIVLSSCGYERIAQTPIAQTPDAQTPGEHQDFEQFCMDVFREEMITADTIDLHYVLTRPEAYQIKPETTSLGPCSLEDMIRDNQMRKELLNKLKDFDRNALSPDQQITYDVLFETLNSSLQATGLELYTQPLSPTIGVQAQLPILLSEYAFYSPKDVETYLELLNQMDRYYREILDFQMQKANAGLAPSDATIENIVRSCKSYLIEPENNFLTETFASRLTDLETGTGITLTAKQKADWENRHVAAIRDHFVPAYRLLIEGMESLKGRGLNEAGLCGSADGKKYYEYLIRSGSGLSYSVPELKEALLRRMEQDYREITELFSKHPDLNDQILICRFRLSDPVNILTDLQEQMVSDFPKLEACDYEIRHVPKQLETALSPAFYLTAPIDNTDHNIIYINNGYTDTSDALYTTLAHEGFPGHLYQTVYHRTHASSPLLSILSSSAANEGWATYVENYACTMDNGLPEPVGKYRALIRSFTLCSQGLLDIGINYEGWNKEQAKKFITSCFRLDDATVDELWQTMIDNPTNYLDYCGGYVEIMEMRDQAQQELGDRFPLKEFHQFLLDIGPVPFSVIRSHFQTWLDNKKSSISGNSPARKWNSFLCMIILIFFALKYGDRLAEI